MKSLLSQIYLYFVIVIVLSLSTVGIFSYVQSSRALDNQAEKYVAQVIDYVFYETELYIRNLELVSNSILSQKQVKQFMDMNPSDSYRYYELSKAIQSEVFQKIFITHPEIHLVYLIGDHGKTIFDDNENLVAFPRINFPERLDVLNRQIPEDGKISVLNDGIEKNDRHDSITLARRIRGASSYQTKGILAIEIQKKGIAELWNTIGLGEEGFFFILNHGGNLIYQPEAMDRMPGLQNRFFSSSTRGEQAIVTVDENGNRHMIVSRYSEYLGWHMALAIPVAELRKPVATIRTTTLYVGLITLLAALLIALRFSHSVVRPIRRLNEGMHETGMGNWNRIKEGDRRDEIGGLIHRYNIMVGRLSETIERVYEAELQNQKSQLELQRTRFDRQRAELQALQMQINPHFLYNTLETINCYAIVQDSEEITEMVEAMAFMLRYSVQTNIEEITLVNELNHVRNFLIILKHRRQKDFEIDVAVDP